MKTVLDLIKSAAKGEELPEEIRLQGTLETIWVRFGDGYYSGKESLGSIVAFNKTWLNSEVEIVNRWEGENES